MKSGRFQLLAGSALVALLVPAAAGAQTAEPPEAAAAAAQADTSDTPASDTADAGAVGDIVVTANKRPERLQDVPVSVSVLTSEVLERQNVREIGDLTKLVPGLTVSYGSQPANFSINMRGIGTFASGIAVESDVAVVIDEVPLGFQAAAFTDLVDVARVEALRGPQSTLFGKSAISGVLNITTMAPTNYWSGKASALVTDDHEWRVGATISGPITDTLTFRLTGNVSDYRGNVVNLAGEDLNGTGARTISGKLLWRPTENVELSFAPHYSRSDSNCCVANVLQSLVPTNGTELYYQNVRQLPASQLLQGVTISPENRRVRMDYRAGGISELVGATVRAAYTLDDSSPIGAATIQYIGSYHDWQMRDFQDVDGTAAPVLLYLPANAPLGLARGAELNGDHTARSTTHELRLTSPGGEFVDYVVGLWYANNDLSRFLDRGPGIAPARYQAYHDNSTAAVFANVDLNLTDKLTLLGGLRLQEQRISYLFQRLLAPEFTLGQEDSDTAVTGKVGAQYSFTRDVMAYATYSTGYKGEAYDLVSFLSPTIAATFPVPAETAKNYEVGLKSSLLNRRLFLNLAAFQADYKGFQVSNTETRPDGSFITFLSSVGKLRARGIEADFLFRPSSNLSLNGAAAWTDAEIVEFPNGPCYPGQTVEQGCRVITSGTGQTTRVQDLAGAPLSNAPRFKFNIGGEYNFGEEGGDIRPFVGFNYRWQSKVNFSLNQNPGTVQESFGIFDAQVGADLMDEQFRVTLFVNNLFDKHYATNLSTGNFGYFDANGVAANGRGWTPARDAFRYFGMRLDAKF